MKSRSLHALLPLSVLLLAAVTPRASQGQVPIQRTPVLRGLSRIVVDAFTVTNPDPNTCAFSWSTDLRNIGTGDTQVAAQVWNGLRPMAGTSEFLKAGGPAMNLAMKNIPHSKSDGNVFRVDVSEYGGGGAVVATATFASPMAAEDALTFMATSGAPTSYTLLVGNPSAWAFPGEHLLFQAYEAATEAGPFNTPAGGTMGTCIAGNGTQRFNATKTAAAKYIKVEVKRGDALVRSKVISITPQVQRSGIDKVPLPR